MAVKKASEMDDFGMYISDLAKKKGIDPKATKRPKATSGKKKVKSATKK